MTPPPGGGEVDHLLRILRRYADTPVGPKLTAALADLAETGTAGLVAFEPGSDERIVESVLAGIHQRLALIVADLRIEIGTVRLEARDWLENLSPDDFGRPS
jgi:hypothetical protein